MLFQTAGFLFVLLPAVAIALRLAPAGTGKRLVILGFSYLFYSGNEPFFVFLLIFSSGLDYAVALGIHATPRVRTRRLLLVASIAGNLGLLGFYKYGVLVLPHISPLGAQLGLPIPDDRFYRTFILPAGISFYTFQSMSYSIDVYRGTVAPERNLLGFFNYVAYLPQLIAGPIERFARLGPRLDDLVAGRASPDWSAGLDRLSVGLAQKLLLADSAGRIVDVTLPQAGEPGLVAAWGIAVGFGVQILYDFSAYTHMAIGVSLMLGVRLSENFRSPYRAASLREFWRRWHITLSTWFRDYVYLPLGGSRGGGPRTALALLVTFLLSGLWHGAGFNFILWGACHGVGVTAQHLVSRARPALRLPRPAGVLVTFVLVHFAWILFRVEDVPRVIEIWRGMVGVNGLGAGAVGAPDLVFLAAVTAGTLALPNAAERWPGTAGWWESALLWTLALLALFNTPRIHQFIYFQF